MLVGRFTGQLPGIRPGYNIADFVAGLDICRHRKHHAETYVPVVLAAFQRPFLQVAAWIGPPLTISMVLGNPHMPET